jgi:hypothetical protein
MADVMYAGLTPERLAVKTSGAAEPVDLVPNGAAMQSHAGARDEEARILRARAELVADAGVGVDC